MSIDYTTTADAAKVQAEACKSWVRKQTFMEGEYVPFRPVAQGVMAALTVFGTIVLVSDGPIGTTGARLLLAALVAIVVAVVRRQGVLKQREAERRLHAGELPVDKAAWWLSSEAQAARYTARDRERRRARFGGHATAPEGPAWAHLEVRFHDLYERLLKAKGWHKSAAWVSSEQLELGDRIHATRMAIENLDGEQTSTREHALKVLKERADLLERRVVAAEQAAAAAASEREAVRDALANEALGDQVIKLAAELTVDKAESTGGVSPEVLTQVEQQATAG